MNLRVASFALAMGALALTYFSAASPAAADSNCPGVRRIVTIGSTPVQINPGGRCNLSFLFNMQRVGLVLDVPVCFFVKRAGSNAKLGPFCLNRPSTGKLPGGVEWIWSEGPAVTIYATLLPRGQR